MKKTHSSLSITQSNPELMGISPPALRIITKTSSSYLDIAMTKRRANFKKMAKSSKAAIFSAENMAEK